MPKVEVCFSPALYDYRLLKSGFDAVVTDVFRASTSICAALHYGIEAVIPVAGLEEAREYRQSGYKVACERGGSVLDFADLGNSPSDFFREDLKGAKVVFSTTNGTKVIQLAAGNSQKVYVGALVNLNALFACLKQRKNDILILCAGWKNLFNLEDTIFSGALAHLLIDHAGYETECDSAKAAIDLWKPARHDVSGYLRKASHRIRLKHLLTEEDYLYSTGVDSCRVVPVLKNGELIAESHNY
ncbi:MAG: 2-phosphosulfolactate phosphatase [Cyclobacteriaceae bacterium]|nr:2-phosphosulfolactate phosphatase [Cyclobacteriaceae bacterium]